METRASNRERDSKSSVPVRRGRVNTPDSTGTRSTRITSGLLAVVAALIAALVLAGPAAAVDPDLVDATPGVTGPMGVFRDDHGALWVADSHAGICRLEPQPHAAGAAMVPSDYCDPTGLLTTRIGPTAPGQSAFDRATGDLFVGDLSSQFGGVWRMHLNESGSESVIDAAVKIYDVSVTDRVFGMSYHPGSKSLDFSTKRLPNILRITNPHTCPAYTDLSACAPLAIGSAEGPATSSLAHDHNGNLYIADVSGITKITNGSSDTQARPVPGLNLGLYTAVAFDADNNRIYAGTTNTEGVDWIDILNLGTNETGTYSVGFDGVTAIGVDPKSPMHNGRLDVIDDPGIKQVGEDLGGTGRHLTVDFGDFAPAPTIVDAPAAISNLQVANFAYRYGSSTSFFCSMDKAPATPCGSGTTGLTSYAGLSSGAHSFTVFVANPTTGSRAVRRFAIDTRAPVASIDTMTISGSNAEFGLSADDINVDFTCQIDAAVAKACDNPARFSGLANGLHTFTVHATDFVGNAGPSVLRSFRIGPDPTTAWTPGKVVATLRGTTLKVVFSAPPDASFARFTLTKSSGVVFRTKPVGVKAGKKNTVTVTLTRAQAEKLQRRTVTLKVVTGPGRSALTTKAGKGTLKITARLSTKGRR
jgi:hypothetical protein